MDTTNLNSNEAKVLRAVINSAQSNGGDFTFGDEVHVPGMSRQTVGAYLSSLEQKNHIVCDGNVRINGSILGTAQICNGDGGNFTDEQEAWAQGDPKAALKAKLLANDYRHGETQQKLRDFAALANVRRDWHEPDEQGVTAVVKGRQLDNACGDGALADPKPIEKVVELRIEGETICRINLATLLALACNPKT